MLFDDKRTRIGLVLSVIGQDSKDSDGLEFLFEVVQWGVVHKLIIPTTLTLRMNFFFVVIYGCQLDCEEQRDRNQHDRGSGDKFY